MCHPNFLDLQLRAGFWPWEALIRDQSGRGDASHGCVFLYYRSRWGEEKGFPDSRFASLPLQPGKIGGCCFLLLLAQVVSLS